MIALYASQVAGPNTTSRVKFLRSFDPGRLVLRITASVTASITTVRNHPSYRVKDAPARHSPHFINEEEAEAASSRSPRAASCANSKKYTTVQTNKARYKHQGIAVDGR